MGDKARIDHILEFAQEIQKAIEGYDWDKFSSNHVLRIAVVKWLENIGEAANHITDETKNKCSGVEWQKIVGLRNIVVHEYFRIDFKVVWDAATVFLPKLKKEIENIRLDWN